MELVVVAGGFGTRLRPLTFHRPKVLLPLLNRPMVLHLLDGLPAFVDHVIVAVNYRYEMIRDFFRREKIGRKTTVLREEEPLGTAGAIKNAEGQIGGTFAAFNGDVVDSIDLDAFLKFHRRHGRIASLGVWPVAEPSAFGVVDLDGNRVTRFVEKPRPGEAPSNLVNAGRYIFEPEIFDFIDAGREVSLERDVFPKLVVEGVSAYRYSGFWSDAGTLSTYLTAQTLLLDAGRGGVGARADVDRADLRNPVLIGDGSFVEGRLGPHVVVGKGCRVGRASVVSSTLMDGASVDDKAQVESSIIGEGATIGEGAVVQDTIVGDAAQVPPHARLLAARVKA